MNKKTISSQICIFCMFDPLQGTDLTAGSETSKVGLFGAAHLEQNSVQFGQIIVPSWSQPSITRRTSIS